MEILNEKTMAELNAEGDAPGASPSPPSPATPELEQTIASLQSQIKEAASRQQLLETQNNLLESQNREMRTQLAAPKPDPAKDITLEQVEESWKRGEISDLDRQRWITRLETKAVLDRRDREAAERQTLQEAATELEEWKGLAPDLDRQGSEILGRVSAAYWRLVKRGFAPDIRTQITAVESVLGPLEAARTRRAVDETTRLRAPVGHSFGASAPASAPSSHSSSRGSQLYDKLTPEAKQFYASMGYDEAATRRTLDFADEETLRRFGRLQA